LNPGRWHVLEEKYEGIYVTFRDGWEVIIHYDEMRYCVDEDYAHAFVRGERYRSGNVLYGQLSLLKTGEITLKANPAKRKFGKTNLEKVADDFIKKIILPTRAPL
jgi:hypothetical protein